jgi:hypothetical protein
MRKIHNAEEMKMKANFETLRQQLLAEEYANRWTFPLAFWTLPNDRRLPLSLLSYKLQDLLNIPFDDLANTAGIGQKKLHSLIMLLQRATSDVPPSKPISVEPVSDPQVELIAEKPYVPLNEQGEFDHTLVSEALWLEWRETAEAHHLGEERLGRLAPSLREMPTVIWHSPLKMYIPQTLHEIRNLRTHGEKRVRVVLEVFYIVHQMLEKAGRHPRLRARLEPGFILPIEHWFNEILGRESLPSKTEIMEHLVLPLIEQLTIDVGADVVHLARGRLGVDGEYISVRQQSREMRVTRARVYQLLEECDRIMEVRWPEGRRFFQDLAERFKSDRRESMASELFMQTYDLFFPKKYARVEMVLTEVE